MIVSTTYRQIGKVFLQKRTLITSNTPCGNPLKMLRLASANRSLCDENTGCRLPDAHFTFCMSTPSLDSDKWFPNLRTVNIIRVTDDGIDFVQKKHSKDGLTNKPVSCLYSIGKYKCGEKMEQWRAEGYCEKFPLSEIIENVPNYSKVGMVAATRKESEEEGESRTLLSSRSEFTEKVQNVRNELQNGEISTEELEKDIQVSFILICVHKHLTNVNVGLSFQTHQS